MDFFETAVGKDLSREIRQAGTDKRLVDIIKDIDDYDKIIQRITELENKDIQTVDSPSGVKDDLRALYERRNAIEKRLEDVALFKTIKDAVDGMDSYSITYRDMIELMQLQRKLMDPMNMGKGEITEAELTAFGKFFEHRYGDDIIQEIEKGLADEFTVNVKIGNRSIPVNVLKEQRLGNELVSRLRTIKFFDEYTVKRFHNEAVGNAVDDFATSYRTSDGTKLTDNVELITRIKKELGTRASIEDVINTFSKYGYINDSIWSWAELDSIAPYSYTPFGDRVRLVQLTGSANYKKIFDKGFHSTGIGVKAQVTPFRMQAVDSGIGSMAYKSGTFKFDALVADIREVMGFGQRANEANSILAHPDTPNSFAILGKELENLGADPLSGVSNVAMDRFITSMIVENGGIPTAAAKKLAKENFYKSLDNYSMGGTTEAKLAAMKELYRNLDSEIVSRKSHNLKDPNAVFESFNIDRDVVEGSVQSPEIYRSMYTRDKGASNPVFTRTDLQSSTDFGYATKTVRLEDLKAVEASGHPTTDLALPGKGSTFVDFSIVHGKTTQFVGRGGSFTISIPKNWRTSKSIGGRHPLIAVGHEQGHVAIRQLDPQTVRDLHEALFSNGAHIEFGGKKVTSTGNVFTDATDVGVVATAEEDLVDIINALYINELVTNGDNAYKIASILKGKGNTGEVDLTKLIQDVKFHDGRAARSINTLSEAIDFFERAGNKNAAVALQQARRAFSDTWASPATRMLLMGQEASPVNSAVKEILDKSYAPFYAKIIGSTTKTNKFVSKFDWGHIFAFNQTDEVARRVFSMKNAFQNESLIVTNEAGNAMRELLKPLRFSTQEKASHTVGMTFMYGVHRFFDDIAQRGFRDFDEFHAFISTKHNTETVRKNIVEHIAGTAKQSDVSAVDDILRSAASGNPRMLNARSTAKVIVNKLVPHESNVVKERYTQEILGFVEDGVAYHRITTNLGTATEGVRWRVKNIFGDITRNIDQLKAISEVFHDPKSITSQNRYFFGINPVHSYAMNGKRILLGTTRNADTIGVRKVRVIDENGMESTKEFYLNVVTDEYAVLGKQSEEFIPFVTSDKARGIIASVDTIQGVRGGRAVEVQGKRYQLSEPVHAIEATYADITKYDSGYLDMSIDKMHANNAYTNFIEQTGSVMIDRQIKMMSDSGMIMTEAKYRRLAETMSANELERWQPLSKGETDSDLISSIYNRYGKIYYDTKYQYNLLGTEGWNYGKFYKQSFGEFGKFMTTMTKGLLGATQYAKRYVLLLRPAAYVNNFVANWFQFTLGAKHPHKAVGYAREAMRDVKTYRQLIRDKYRLQYGQRKPGQTQTDIDNAVAKIDGKMKSMKIHYAFEEGILSTIKDQAYTSGTIDDNILKQIVNSSNTLDKKVNNVIDFLSLSEQTKLGKALADTFDSTELVPKMAYYYDALAHYKDPGKALGDTLTMFASYENMNPAWAMVDAFQPFTKFMLAYPHMLAAAVTKNTHRLAALQSMYLLGIHASWAAEGSDLTEREEWLKGHGFINLPLDVSKFGPSMNMQDPRAFFMGTNPLDPFPLQIARSFGEFDRWIGVTPTKN